MLDVNLPNQRSLGYPRLRSLYVMMGGIPALRVSLSNWRQWERNGKRNLPDDAYLLNGCNTIACMGGWASAYPEFNDQGLRWTNVIYYKDRGSTYRSFEAVGRFFGGPDSDEVIENMFDYSSGYDRANFHPKVLPEVADKYLAMDRIRTFLLLSGAITEERNAELQALELEAAITESTKALA